MSKRNNWNTYSVSDFYCVRCGRKGIGVPRKTGQDRAPGHLKKLYCIYCQRYWNHVEVREIFGDYMLADFQLEMAQHNFDEEGNRKVPYRILRGEYKKQMCSQEV